MVYCGVNSRGEIAVIEVDVTRVFHKDGPDGEERGTAVTTKETFANMDAAIEFGHSENAKADRMGSHITNVFQDTMNFCCFDISDIWDAAGPGFIDDYNRLNPR